MRLLIIPLFALLSACGDTPDPTPVTAPDGVPTVGDNNRPAAPAAQQLPLAGSWVLEDDSTYRVMVLGRDGSLHWLPNGPWQGQRWQADEQTLTLHSLARHRGDSQTLAVGYTLHRHTLTLTELDPDGEHDTATDKGVLGPWRRNDQAAARVEGELLLPDGHSVPERAVLALHIEPRDVRDPDVTDIQRKVRPLEAGLTHIPYRLYYDARAVDDTKPLQLQATIIVDGAAHYASDDPIRLAPVTEQSQTLVLAPRGLARGQPAASD
ncbi:hypothetical protein [Isoalcanivorax indicus]|uniref:hypothetical protein n=1 Tax=Isoalcanivorax indicus TaxID=2202653 RepID=UPI000DBA8CAA|nr:hypothetical protein [Isoalcanivorax indicus]